MADREQEAEQANRTGAEDALTRGLNSISPVGDPEGGVAAGNLTGVSPGEGIPERGPSAPEPSGQGSGPIGGASLDDPQASS